MPLPAEISAQLRAFHEASRFAERGAVITDLDGTAVHEREGRNSVALPVVDALKALVDLGRPVVLNTLRFPLNVIRTFGREWNAITSQPLPLVSLNGAVIGFLVPTEEGDPTFEELAAFPLSVDQIEALISKYASASAVRCTPVAELRELLLSHGATMLSVLVDIPADRLMAYQHANPNRFITATGVDKLSGAREAAARLDFDLDQSVGAGDTPMDRFLAGVGLAVHVAPMALEFSGRAGTVRLRDPFELGEALFELAGLSQAAVAVRPLS